MLSLQSVEKRNSPILTIVLIKKKYEFHRSECGQGKKILQGQGKVRIFYFESGKIDILKKSQGKLK